MVLNILHHYHHFQIHFRHFLLLVICIVSVLTSNYTKMGLIFLHIKQNRLPKIVEPEDNSRFNQNMKENSIRNKLKMNKFTSPHSVHFLSGKIFTFQDCDIINFTRIMKVAKGTMHPYMTFKNQLFVSHKLGISCT